jgi:hypothetical protein
MEYGRDADALISTALLKREALHCLVLEDVKTARAQKPFHIMLLVAPVISDCHRPSGVLFTPKPYSSAAKLNSNLQHNS